jgi:hypothetical protein
MMPPPNMVDLNLLIQQLPHLSKVATALRTHPDQQRAALFEKAVQQHELSKEQVQEIERTEKSKLVDREGAGGGQQGDAGTRQHSKGDSSEEMNTASNASPWTGNLINIKI